MLYSLSALGATVILVGIISLIAANWDELSKGFKLTGYFIGLVLLGTASLFYRNRSALIFETLAGALALYVLAGIGLIGQVYNLKSTTSSAIFFWLVAILPLTLLSNSKRMADLWLGGFVVAWIIMLTESLRSGIFLFEFTYSLPVIFLTLGYLFSKQFEQASESARLWSYAAILSVSLIGYSHLPLDYRGSDHSGGQGALLLLALTFIAIYASRRFSTSTFIRRTIALLLITSLIGTELRLLDFQIMQSHWVSLLFIVVTWGCAAALSAAMERRGLFNICTGVILIRFIIVYFEVFGSLAETGLGLIFSGVVILGAAYTWHHFREYLNKAIREAAQ